MNEQNKWLIRAFVAIASILAIIVFSGFALFSKVDMGIFWRVFATLNVYAGWFFTSREIEKRK